jgi:hypothetical protein
MLQVSINFIHPIAVSRDSSDYWTLLTSMLLIEDLWHCLGERRPTRVIQLSPKWSKAAWSSCARKSFKFVFYSRRSRRRISILAP